jgi:hypothetical protein
MMHRMLWWIIIIIIISFLHHFDLFCKAFCTKIEIRSSKWFNNQDKICNKSKRDQPSLSCTIAIPFILGGGGGRLLVLWFIAKFAKSTVVQIIWIIDICSHPLPPLPHFVCVSLTKDICL